MRTVIKRPDGTAYAVYWLINMVMNMVNNMNQPRFSHSRLADLKACGLRYYFKHVVGLRKHEDSADQHHLRYGGAMHEALAVLYSANYASNHDYDRARLMDLVKQTFLDAYPVQLDPADQAKTRDNGVRVLDWYAAHWHDEDAKWRVVSVEKAEDTDAWSLRLDLVMENIEYGGIYSWDHKITKKYLNYDFWNTFDPNSQITQYVDHVRERYGECSGFFINAISMGHRQRAYKGEPAGFWAKFERQMFNRNAEQLQQERQSTERAIEIASQAQAMIEAGTDAVRAYGFNTDSCRFCEFRPVCAAGWTWERDSELIEIQFRRACLEIIPGGRCQLDRGHEDDHALDVPLEELGEVVVE